MDLPKFVREYIQELAKDTWCDFQINSNNKTIQRERCDTQPWKLFCEWYAYPFFTRKTSVDVENYAARAKENTKVVIVAYG